VSSLVKISVLVPVYRGEKTLEKCLSSIANQSFGSFEVIVVNDGSPDNSQQIINRFAAQHRNFKGIVSTENRGIMRTLERAFLESQGEYILIVENDDWLERDTLRILYQMALSVNADLVRYDCYWVKNGQRNPMVLSEQTNMLWAKLIKRSFFEKLNIGDLPSINNHNDTLITKLMVYFQPTTTYLPMNLYNYTVRPGSTSRTIDYKYFMDTIAFYDYLTTKYQEWGIYDEQLPLIEDWLNKQLPWVKKKTHRVQPGVMELLLQFYQEVAEDLLEAKRNIKTTSPQR